MKPLLPGALVLAAVSAFAQTAVRPPVAAPPRTLGIEQARPPQKPSPGPPTQRTGTAAVAVAGVVVDGSGKGVPAAVVRLIGETAFRTVIADNRGRFSFPAMAPGEYVVTANKFGFFEGAYGRRRAGGDPLPLSLAAGQAVLDMRIELYRGAVITGFVIDEANEPVVGARVVVVRRKFGDGDWAFAAAGLDTTDDQGEYRFYGLEPGEYLVSTPTTQIAGAVPANRIPIGELPHTEASELAYPSLYYPASRYFLLAMPLHVAPGEVRYAVNFQWTPVPAFAIRGRLSGPAGSTADQLVKLLPLDGRDIEDANESAVTMSDPTGAFEFERVPAGEYRIEAGNAFSSPSIVELTAPGTETAPDIFWGRANLTVADQDTGNVHVVMRTGLSVTGMIQTDPDRRSLVSRLPITIVPARAGLTRRSTPRIFPNGRFAVSNLVPGEYYVRVGTLPLGWSLQSVTAGGIDLLDEPIQLEDSDVTNVTIRLTDRAPTIRGSVRDARLQAASGAAIIVMPSSGNTWSPNRTRHTRASTNGQFGISGLPPGDYLIVAVDDAALEGWQDARVLSQLRSLATRIALRSEDQTLHLRLSSLRR